MSGVSLYRPGTLSIMWYNWSLQASVTLTPRPHPSSTFPVSPLLCCCLFGSGLLVLILPRTPGVSVCSLSVSLSFQSTTPKAFAARKISLTSEYTSYVFTSCMRTCAKQEWDKNEKGNVLLLAFKTLVQNTVFQLQINVFDLKQAENCQRVSQNSQR